jgi:hypothetical protein
LSIFKLLVLTVLVLGLTHPARAVSMNPDTSVNGLFLYQNSSRGNDVASPTNLNATENGLTLQEAEMQFLSDVDPYWRLNALFSVHQDRSMDKDNNVKREWKIEPEEVFVDTIALPFVTARVGKFKAAMGRHNQLHTHAFPFIDAPLFLSKLLGDEGLNDTGVSASALLPGIPWFSEITLQGFSGRADGVSDYYGSGSPNSEIGVAHLKNLWDFGTESTVELGLSGANGKNQFDLATDLIGADLTFKWRPAVFGNSRAIIWSTESLQRTFRQTSSTEVGKGIATWVIAQVSHDWWVQARTEYLEQKGVVQAVGGTTDSFARKQSALIGYLPTEFSGIRAQYDYLTDAKDKPEQKVSLQFNYTIGAHPAHMY